MNLTKELQCRVEEQQWPLFSVCAALLLSALCAQLLFRAWSWRMQWRTWHKGRCEAEAGQWVAVSTVWSLPSGEPPASQSVLGSVLSPRIFPSLCAQPSAQAVCNSPSSWWRREAGRCKVILSYYMKTHTKYVFPVIGTFFLLLIQQEQICLFIPYSLKT